MIFTLEALRARHGDSLIVHFGDPRHPRFVVIDGGPSGVYKDAFRPRLDALSARWPTDGKLSIDVLMISHLDDDHIRGVLDLSDKLLETRKTQPSPFEVRTLWHNTFDDIIGNGATQIASALADAPSRIAAADDHALQWSGDATAVVASVPQGRRLRDNAKGLGWASNKQFAGELIIAASDGVRTEALGPLKLTVIGPMQDEVQKLQDDWDDHLRSLEAADNADDAAQIAEYLDRSVYNLSSIVVMAELNQKRMLLTGDARGDLILAGLRRAGLLADADDAPPLKVDILKLPHHGSDRNVDDDFFERIHARHYVASGDGAHKNPSPATLAMIAKARPDDQFTIHLTYENMKSGIGQELAVQFDADRRAGRHYGVVYRREADLSLKVDLLDPVTY